MKSAMYAAIVTGCVLLSMQCAAPGAHADIFGCFKRTYDKAHLAQHPDQLVTKVKLRIYRPPPDASGSNAWVDMEARVRGRDVTLAASAACRKGEPTNPQLLKHLPPPDALWCYVECDGGGIGVASRGDHVMMYLGEIRVDVRRDDASCSGDSDTAETVRE